MFVFALSNTCIVDTQVTVYTLRPEEALTRLRREGIQKIYQEREGREHFIVDRVESDNTLQENIGGFLKGERDLKDLGTMLSAPKVQDRPEQEESSKRLPRTPLRTHSIEGSLGSPAQDADSPDLTRGVHSEPSLYSVDLQPSASNISSRNRVVGGKKPARCRVPNRFKVSDKEVDMMKIVNSVRKPIAEDKSNLVTRGEPPQVPGFTKSPGWLDGMGYRFAVPVKDPLHTRESEAQQKLYEAFLIYENWQNVGKIIDLHRYIELMKASHLVGSKSDPRDNLLTSVTLDDAIKIFKQVSSAALPTASLLRGRNSINPQFELSRFGFSQCMYLVAKQLCVQVPRIHNFPVEEAANVPVSNKYTRVSLSGVEANMRKEMTSKALNSMREVSQEKLDISQSGRPGSLAYVKSAPRRPATSCGFIRATGMKESTADGIGRDFSAPERPHSSVIRMVPSRPGSACVVSMLVESEPSNPTSRIGNPGNSPASQRRPKSVMDQMHGDASHAGMLSYMQRQREQRTRSIKRSLKRVHLPDGLRRPPENTQHKAFAYQMLQDQLYGASDTQKPPSLHFVSPSIVDQQVHAPPDIARHEHLHAMPVFFSSLSQASLVAAQYGILPIPPVSLLSCPCAVRAISF